jgi:hypothetical protein
MCLLAIKQLLNQNPILAIPFMMPNGLSANSLVKKNSSRKCNAICLKWVIKFSMLDNPNNNNAERFYCNII